MASIDDILNTRTVGRQRPINVNPVSVAAPVSEATGVSPTSEVSSTGTVEAQADKDTAVDRLALSSPKGDATTLVGAPGKAPVEKMEHTIESKPMSWTDLYQAMNPYRPESDEDRAKRERREKIEGFLSAFGDGVSALSNLYFTSRYSPNAYNANGGLSAKTKERWDKLRAEREAKDREYFNGYLRMRAMDKEREKEERAWNHSLEREKKQDEAAARKEQMEMRKSVLDEMLKNHQISAAKYKAEQERIKAEYEEGNQELKQENLRAGIRQKNASAGASHANAVASYARANYYGKKGPTLQLEDDDPLHFGDDKDYDRTVMSEAAERGIPIEVEDVLERDPKGNPKKVKTRQRPVKDIAADVERDAKKKREASKQNKTEASQDKKSSNTQTNSGNSGKRWGNTSNIKW